ncbi:hypothetical protein SeMB42_g00503 [Synchytrium endobioticum]|uniref:PUM-HD domain-containing protein n=1 Tax=Synchytrium endobioticum TaxID=286115 RepID=A0A507DJN6_9FUNG|nr:hypothetical protein SeLEV6574_g00069 [Synchytrium endobioticum]TPX53960.1 hypothetical protein SeMB42_g00503 [Synchytrium endobioticum]
MAKEQQRKSHKKASSSKKTSGSSSTLTKRTTKRKPQSKKTAFQREEAKHEVEESTHVEVHHVVDMGGAHAYEGDDGHEADSDQHLDTDVDGELGDDEAAPAAKKARTENGGVSVSDTNGGDAKKPSRDEQKRLLKERKSQKPHSDLIFTAKKLWEQLRPRDMKPSKRAEVMKELMNAVQGHIQDLIFKHDLSRVVQSMLKHGSSAQRDAIAAELKGTFVDLSKNQYSRFLVARVLDYCPKYRDTVMKEFHGQVRKLMRQKSASLIIEEAYTRYANATQRSQLIEEFYGPQYALFKGTGGSSLAELIKESPAKKPYIMKHLREAIDHIIDKGTADIGPHSIVHRVILEYLNHADTSDIVSLVEPLKDQIIRILHTREGSRVSQILFAHAGAKDRKHVIKTMKSYVAKVAKEQYGCAVLMSILECTDDTVLSGKACVGEFVLDSTQLKECCMNEYASRVILHGLVGRNNKYLTGPLVSALSGLDTLKSSKKDDALKHNELLAVWKQPLKDVVIKNFEELVKDKFGSLVVAETLRVLGDNELFSKLTELLSASIDSPNNGIDDKASNVKENSGNLDEELHTESDTESAYQTPLETPLKENHFHPIKALAAELKKPTIVTNTEHVLTNRTSNAILKDLITSGRRPLITENAPLSPDTEIAGKISETIASAIQPSISEWLEYCSKDVKRSSGTAFVLVALVECGNDNARRVVFDGIKSFGVERLMKEIEKLAETGEAMKKKTDAKKGCKRKRDGEISQSVGPSMSGLQVLLHRYNELVT